MIDRGTAAAGIEREVALGQDPRLGPEAAGEDDAVAGDGRAIAALLDLDRLDLRQAADRRKPRTGQDWQAPEQTRGEIGREWVFRGRRLSYANAGCPDGRLQAKGQFRFRDGTVLQGSVLKRCRGK